MELVNVGKCLVVQVVVDILFVRLMWMLTRLMHYGKEDYTHTHNRLTAFVWDNPGRPVPEETLTHSHPT